MCFKLLISTVSSLPPDLTTGQQHNELWRQHYEKTNSGKKMREREEIKRLI